MPFAARVILCVFVFIGVFAFFSLAATSPFLPTGLASLLAAIAVVALVWLGSGTTSHGFLSVLMTTACWAAVGFALAFLVGFFGGLATGPQGPLLSFILWPVGLIVGGIGGLIYGLRRALAPSPRPLRR